MTNLRSKLVDILRDRHAQAAGARAADLLAEIGDAEDGAPLERIDVADATSALWTLAEDVRKRAREMCLRAADDARKRGCGVQAVKDEVEIMTRCCAVWFTGWTSPVDEALAACGRPLTTALTIADVAARRRARWLGGEG